MNTRAKPKANAIETGANAKRSATDIAGHSVHFGLCGKAIIVAIGCAPNKNRASR
jgi:hypothetical protein